MTSRQAQQAAEVLRQHAPHQTHEVRRACHEAIESLDAMVMQMSAPCSSVEFRMIAARTPNSEMIVESVQGLHWDGDWIVAESFAAWRALGLASAEVMRNRANNE